MTTKELILRVYQEDNPNRGETVGSIKKKLKENLKALQKKFRQSADEAQTGAGAWFVDNYYIFEREIKTCLQEMAAFEGPGSRRFGRLGEALFAVLSLAAPEISEETLTSVLAEIEAVHALSQEEFNFLPLAVKLALLRQGALAATNGGDEEKIAYTVKSFVGLLYVDFEKVCSDVSTVEKILLRDPAGVYPDMDKQSKGAYKNLLSALARKRGMPEYKLAEEILRQAGDAREPVKRHVGYYLVGSPLLKSEAKRKGRLLILLNFLTPTIAALGLALFFRNILILPLLIFPLWEIFRVINELVIAGSAEPDFIPRMDFDKLDNTREKTVVLVSALMPKPENVKAVCQRVEELYYANMEPNLHFCLLCDFKESRYPQAQQDKAQVSALKRELAALNARHGNRFMLFIRKRSYNRNVNRFFGWERKRGAIVEFVRFLKGESTSVLLFEGDKKALPQLRHMIALDSDTDLGMDTARELIATAAHILNRPAVDENTGIVTGGYGILAPAMQTELESANATMFAKVMAGRGGVSVYDSKSGDWYQDLFGEGIFAGKGLLNIDAFYQTLNSLFPENTVLSHDILEGAVLRTAALSEIKLCDSFPSNASAWLDRLHRWVRGDWQNIIFLKKSFTRNGEKVENNISPLSKYKLFDNLRRSLTPVACGLLLLLSAFFDVRFSAAISAVVLLSVCAPNIVSGVRLFFSEGVYAVSRKYFADILPLEMQNLFQTLFSLTMLLQTAVVSADAILKALWRSFVSQKHMLEWVPASELRQGKGLVSLFGKYFLNICIGVLLFLFAPYWFLKLWGLLFILLLPVAMLTGRKKRRQTNPPRDADLERLTSYSALMWDFYEEYVTEKDNYLPVDNVSFAPVFQVAHRTSPTNIGLFLLSVLAARDFSFIDTDQMARMLENTLSAVERLEKHAGNLYNWYDTQTLELLKPAFVSSVDSGNFVCCLVALSEGLAEYASQSVRIGRLRERLDKLAAETDVTIFYDKRRKLFSIGLDENLEKLPSCYDFLMSEARLLSYYAIASRGVEKKHWSVLGRDMSGIGRYAGPVSWSGTMFEYFMPHILLPVYENSLLSEALSFCLYAQKKRAMEKNVPWGISESAYFAFDTHFNYQYKAHGVQKLGFKRGLDRELVISAYSTFLTLPFDFEGAMRNLAKMERMGLCGSFGFYESCDFTRERTKNATEVCRSFMSHHIGMSFLSAANARFDHCMQKRFMKNGLMQSARELLQEKVGRDAIMYDNLRFRQAGPGREKPERFAHHEEEPNPTAPVAGVLTNLELTSVNADNGGGYLLWRGLDITRRSIDGVRRPQGIFCFLRRGGEVLSLTQAPAFDRANRHEAVFSPSACAYKLAAKNLSADMACFVHSVLPCEVRKLTVKNLSGAKADLDAVFWFEPILQRFADYDAHPAFSKLFVTAEYDRDNKLLLFTRRKKGDEQPIFLAAGFLEGTDFEYETVKENLIFPPYGLSRPEAFVGAAFSKGNGTPDAVCAMRLKMRIAAQSKASVTFFLSVAQTRDEAVTSAVKLRQDKNLTRSAAENPLIDDSLLGRTAFALQSKILFAARGPGTLEAIAANRLGKEALWSLSISGDRPIVLLTADTNLAGQWETYIRLLIGFRAMQIDFDLVIAGSGGEYPDFKGQAERIARAVNAGELLGKRIFIINADQIQPEKLTLLKAMACYILPDDTVAEAAAEPPYEPVRILPVSRAERQIEGYAVNGGTFMDNRFYVDKKSPLPYCNVLSNPAFGTLVSDKALGFTFAVNARENKITPWINDIATDNCGEMLILKTKEGFFDLINGSLCSFSPEDARYEGRAGEIGTDVTVTVAGKGCAKVMEIFFENNGDTEQEIQCACYIEPVLGVNELSGRYVTSVKEGGRVTFRNRVNEAVRTSAVLASDQDTIRSVSSKCDFFSGRWEKESSLPQTDPCGAVIIAKKLPPKRREKIRFILSWGANEESAQRMQGIEMRRLPPPQNSIAISTPDEDINQFINVWCPHQIRACRLFARTAFYQNGGAYGFRDQLQDVSAYLLLEPKLAKRQILRAAAVQFKEGDVLHWWHNLPKSAGGLRGVRTRCSDDLLWLPYAVCEYTEKTGDLCVFELPVAWLDAPELASYEHDRYFAPKRTERKAPLFEHCIKAIERGLNKGENGLIKIGGGDWNDGGNLIGHRGKGTSVWLSMFICVVMEKFLPILEAKDRTDLAEQYRGEIASIKEAIDKHAWDGGWYLRAFFDNGEKLGGRLSEECMIDSLSQSFSALADMPDKERVNRSLDHALRYLYNKEDKLVKLFTKPFENAAPSPGYIMAYPPGIRENGGQYTHAGVWLAMALLHEGRNDEGYELLNALSASSRCADERLSALYKTEPYFLAADIYANKNAYLHGGWSIYTGAAAWYYRAVIESLLGIKITAGAVCLSPRLPANWPGFSAKLTIAGTAISLTVKNNPNAALTVDGTPSEKIPLDGINHIAILE